MRPCPPAAASVSGALPFRLRTVRSAPAGDQHPRHPDAPREPLAPRPVERLSRGVHEGRHSEGVGLVHVGPAGEEPADRRRVAPVRRLHERRAERLRHAAVRLRPRYVGRLERRAIRAGRRRQDRQERKETKRTFGDRPRHVPATVRRWGVRCQRSRGGSRAFTAEDGKRHLSDTARGESSVGPCWSPGPSRACAPRGGTSPTLFGLNSVVGVHPVARLPTAREEGRRVPCAGRRRSVPQRTDLRA